MAKKKKEAEVQRCRGVTKGREGKQDENETRKRINHHPLSGLFVRNIDAGPVRCDVVAACGSL